MLKNQITYTVWAKNSKGVEVKVPVRASSEERAVLAVTQRFPRAEITGVRNW